MHTINVINKACVEQHMEKILTTLFGEGWQEDPNLKGTPERIAKMYVYDFFSSINEEFDGFSAFPNNKGYDQIIISEKIFFSSVCSHHFLPFTGFAYIAYIPDEYLVGASKPARLVEHYAKRPQLQENLCHDVIEAFDNAIQPKGCMVLMKAIHDCMMCRGVRQTNGNSLTTNALKGVFYEEKVKLEALQLISLDILNR